MLTLSLLSRRSYYSPLEKCGLSNGVTLKSHKLTGLTWEIKEKFSILGQARNLPLHPTYGIRNSHKKSVFLAAKGAILEIFKKVEISILGGLDPFAYGQDGQVGQK